MAQKLFIGGLSFGTSIDDLGQFLSGTEDVHGVAVVTDRDTARSRDFGFVEVANSRAADETIRRPNDSAPGGRAPQVEIAKPSVPGSSGGDQSGRCGRSERTAGHRTSRPDEQ